MGFFECIDIILNELNFFFLILFLRLLFFFKVPLSCSPVRVVSLDLIESLQWKRIAPDHLSITLDEWNSL